MCRDQDQDQDHYVNFYINIKLQFNKIYIKTWTKLSSEKKPRNYRLFTGSHGQFTGFSTILDTFLLFVYCFYWLIDLRPCQHDNGYMDCQLQIYTDKRTQAHSAQSSLPFHSSRYWPYSTLLQHFIHNRNLHTHWKLSITECQITECQNNKFKTFQHGFSDNSVVLTLRHTLEW